MKKRELMIDTAQKALKAMLAMLDADMIGNDLVECDPTQGGVELHGTFYPVKLVWLKRGDKGLVGCPCFICDFCGIFPSGRRVESVMYVKAFALRTGSMCKMHLRDEKAKVKYTEIADGQTFVIDDQSRGYEKGTYLYKNGVITPL